MTQPAFSGLHGRRIPRLHGAGMPQRGIPTGYFVSALDVSFPLCSPVLNGRSRLQVDHGRAGISQLIAAL